MAPGASAPFRPLLDPALGTIDGGNAQERTKTSRRTEYSLLELSVRRKVVY